MSAAANLARIAALTDIKPAIAIVLGSGLGGFVDTAEDAVTIPYTGLHIQLFVRDFKLIPLSRVIPTGSFESQIPYMDALD